MHKSLGFIEENMNKTMTVDSSDHQVCTLTHTTELKIKTLSKIQIISQISSIVHNILVAHFLYFHISHMCNSFENIIF